MILAIMEIMESQLQYYHFECAVNFLHWDSSVNQITAPKLTLSFHGLDALGELSLDSVCAICRKGHLINTTECPIVAPLVREFLSGPLTLLQLSRIEIRRLIGVRHFERRVNSLKRQLPPLVFCYISLADEMLAENSNEVELSNEFHEL